MKLIIRVASLFMTLFLVILFFFNKSEAEQTVKEESCYFISTADEITTAHAPYVVKICEKNPGTFWSNPSQQIRMYQKGSDTVLFEDEIKMSEGGHVRWRCGFNKIEDCTLFVAYDTKLFGTRIEYWIDLPPHSNAFHKNSNP